MVVALSGVGMGLVACGGDGDANNTTPGTHTVLWINGETQLEKDEKVAKNAAPSYDGTKPTKAGNGTHLYDFAGWSVDKNATAGRPAGDLPTVTANVTYYAIFTENEIYTYNGATITGLTTFARGVGLTALALPSSVAGITIRGIGDRAFVGCTTLTDIAVPNTVTTIGDYAFSGCSNLVTITIPNTVTTIGEYAFADCAALPGITLPNSVTAIGQYAFSFCTNLGSITIPNGVTAIGEGIFADCTALTDVNIPNSITAIGQYAFSNCATLTTIIIPNSVMTIGDYAFSRCAALTNVNLPAGVTAVGECAFSDCADLTDIIIPDSVTTIGNFAFDNCTGITIYVFVSAPPEGWDSFWNVYSWDFSNYPVKYAGEWHIDETTGLPVAD
jgi:uncharacterized repeat protein (TIGR02543 family)